MRHRKHTFKIGRKPAHRRAMLANMACSLLRAGRIKTTLTRGKEVRRLVDKMITLGKNGSLAARRRAISILGQKDVVRYLFDELSAGFAERQGGYTRVLKLGQRQGDAAEMCFVELVSEPVSGRGDTVGADDQTMAAEAEIEQKVEASVADGDRE